MNWWRKLFGGEASEAKKQIPVTRSVPPKKTQQELRKPAPSGMRTEERKEPADKTDGKRYYNKQWNFSIVYPADWELLWENRPQGSWVMAVAVAGKARGRVRPGLIVNVRRGEVLEGSSNVTVIHIGGDATAKQAPKTPSEYIERSKADLSEAFSGLRFLSGEEIRLINKPATRVVYSYETNSGRMQEMCVTIFGVGVTFQITCEVAPDEFDKFKPAFDAIINSFNIGSEPSSAIEPKTTVQPTKAEGPIQQYNRGVDLYQKGQFRAAMDTFGRVFKSGELKMQSAYIRALCQKELGLSVEIPPELGDKAEDAGTVYVASNLACHIIAKGHKAALTKQESTSEVTALIDGSLYVISISSLLGGFNNWAWRKEGDKSISVPDPDANPNPTKTDRFVIALAEKAGVMPPEPMPKGGLEITWGNSGDTIPI